MDSAVHASSGYGSGLSERMDYGLKVPGICFLRGELRQKGVGFYRTERGG